MGSVGQAVTVRSTLPAYSTRPSRLHSTSLVPASVPLGSAQRWRPGTVHSRILWSIPAVASRWSSGLNVIAATGPMWPPIRPAGV
ncbi:MAG: hypothetical protein AUI14_06380 [Actinobacteria bacterium 13_2_20CM_2_71_6]|nr:MAG: hypothetical protein AUI14_06380 [Actinobacteria bacterium 13_2_20CM_2_71_6]